MMFVGIYTCNGCMVTNCTPSLVDIHASSLEGCTVLSFIIDLLVWLNGLARMLLPDLYLRDWGIITQCVSIQLLVTCLEGGIALIWSTVVS